MAMTSKKNTLVLYKQRMEMPIAIQRCDVMSLVNHMVAPSFHLVESNIKALWVRGRVECNLVLMDHTDVQRNTARIKVLEDRAASAAALEAPTASAAIGTDTSTPLAVARDQTQDVVQCLEDEGGQSDSV